MESTLDHKAEREEITRIIDLTNRYMNDERWKELDDMLMQIDYSKIDATAIIAWLRSSFIGSAKLPHYTNAVGRALIALKRRNHDYEVLRGLPVKHYVRLWLHHA